MSGTWQPRGLRILPPEHKIGYYSKNSLEVSQSEIGKKRFDDTPNLMTQGILAVIPSFTYDWRFDRSRGMHVN